MKQVELVLVPSNLSSVTTYQIFENNQFLGITKHKPKTNKWVYKCSLPLLVERSLKGIFMGVLAIELLALYLIFQYIFS